MTDMGQDIAVLTTRARKQKDQLLVEHRRCQARTKIDLGMFNARDRTPVVTVAVSFDGYITHILDCYAHPSFL